LKPEPDEITVQLSWFHTVEFAGFYVADQKGYYAEENLQVNLVQGGFEVSTIDEVLEGQADFGIAGGDQLLIVRSENAPLQAVMTIFRQSPVALMALEDSGIRKPEDLAGKRVGIFSPNMNDVNDIQFLAMLRNVDVDLDDITTVLIQDYSVGSLTSGTMDVYNGFATNEAVDAEMRGIDLNLIFPSDYGVLVYANALFTDEELLRQQPELVERFVRATIRGYEDALANPEEAAEMTLRYDPELDLEFQQASMNAEIPLIDTGDAPIGTMDAAVWSSTQEILLNQRLLEKVVDLETVYTNEFIENAR
jgi:ABC-type nitrate/sulfonate/bicarbonate transport system substrate-binding protein